MEMGWGNNSILLFHSGFFSLCFLETRNFTFLDKSAPHPNLGYY